MLSNLAGADIAAIGCITICAVLFLYAVAWHLTHDYKEVT